MSPYCYSSLPEDSIRLLRLMPHQDEYAPIECQLFDCNLLDSEGTRPYEALSYVWGSEDKPQSISIHNCGLPVGANLHSALLHLRDRFIERIIWIDAVCINQGDPSEKGQQVQLMAKIYAKASRVIVWLGEASVDSDQVLEEIRISAVEQSTKSSNNKTNQQAILQLLQRPWFQRIWVLQEVAAARHVLIKCGQTEIDGYAFCSGLSALKLSYETCEDLQSLIRSVTYLIRGAVFRARYATSRTGRFSLDIRPLHELIDMYHTRKATERRDKVYALLGMSSDDPSAPGLSADYEILWRQLFQQLVNSLLSKQLSVDTWDDKEIAVIKGRGCVLGEVSSVERDIAWDDRQNVNITWKNAPLFFGKKKAWSSRLTFQASAKSIQIGDAVCLLQGAPRPTIIRLCNDYCTVISIAVPLPDDLRATSRDVKWSEILRPITAFPVDFLLVWDWEMPPGRSRDETDYEYFMNSRVLKCSKTDLEAYPDKATRIRNIGLVLQGMERYQEAGKNLRKAIEVYERERSSTDTLEWAYPSHGHWGMADVRRLAVMVDISMRSGDYRRITEDTTITIAKSFDRELVRFLLDRRGKEVQITEAVVKAAAGNYTSGKEVIKLLLDKGQGKVQITKGAIAEIARRFDQEVMELLLDQIGDEIQITEAVVEAAAGNGRSGKEVTKLLLNRMRDDMQITEGTFVQIARGFDQEVMKFLLDKSENEMQITEAVVKAAAGNGRSGREMIKLLLDRRGKEVQITEAVAEAAAGNNASGKEVMKLLLDKRGAEMQITEAVVKAATGNERNGREVMELLLDKGGSKVQVTEAVVKEAARNYFSGKEVIKRLLDKGESGVQVTDAAAAQIARRFDQEVMKLLLDRQGDGIRITRAIVEAAAGNRKWSESQKEWLRKRQGKEVD